MKGKKWLVGVLATLCAATSAVALAGCGDDDNTAQSSQPIDSSQSSQQEQHVHAFGEWTLYSPTTVSCEQRMYYRVCTDCNDIEWKMNITGGHNWQNKYTIDNNFHWLECEECNEIKNKKEHIVGENAICGTCQEKVWTPGIIYKNCGTHAEVIGYEGTETDVIIAREYDGKSVKTISDMAFKYCTSLTSIVVPDSVHSIGSYAFSYCDNLTSVVIGDGVTSIEEGVFSYCTSLTSVDIPDGVTTIGERAFYDCRSLTSVDIPDSVTTIGEEAFENCYSLTSIVIPDSVTTIGRKAFAWCNGLTSAVIPDSVITIGCSAFECCGLTSIVIPDSVTSIGDEAFAWCNGLTSVVIGDGVTWIGAMVLYSCDSLTSVYYKGTAEDWADINIDSNYYLTNATRYYYSETEPTVSGNFWHYDENGTPVIWEIA